MSTDVEQQTYVMIPIEKIISDLSVRKLSEAGVARIQESMRWAGFLENYPLTVVPLGNGNFGGVDGLHRRMAAIREGITHVPCIVVANLSDAERYKLAMQSNNAAEAVVPSTMVTYAEFIWARLEEQDGQGKKKYTQSEVGDMLGWERESVRNYAGLQKICPDAWSIVGTAFEKVVPMSSVSTVPGVGTTVPFTEYILRSILDLTPEQQLELVSDLAGEKIEKPAFTKLAKSYRARNELKTYALQQMATLGEPYLSQFLRAADSGAYDAEWQHDKEHKEHPKLDKLLKSLHDEWDQKSSYRLIHGDFYESVKLIEDGSVDLLLTDPPYNIARENEFEYDGRSNVSQDFGEWDKYEHQDFLDKFTIWAREWARVLRHQGSGYVFTSDSYLSHLRASLETADLHVKATIVWHKTNPGTQPVKTGFRSSIEYILFFTKGEGNHTFNWQGENEMHNFIEAPVCQGRERLVDAKNKTLHPTQKPERVLEHFLKISSNRGDMVFDGFMGVGSTGKVAQDQGRKFIGIEQDKTFFDAAQRRLAE